MSSHEVSPYSVQSQNMVRIHSGLRSPYSGRYGVVVGINPEDPYGPYMVEFDDGLRFRYTLAEIELIPAHATAVPGSDVYRRAS